MTSSKKRFYKFPRRVFRRVGMVGGQSFKVKPVLSQCSRYSVSKASTVTKLGSIQCVKSFPMVTQLGSIQCVKSFPRDTVGVYTVCQKLSQWHSWGLYSVSKASLVTQLRPIQFVCFTVLLSYCIRIYYLHSGMCMLTVSVMWPATYEIVLSVSILVRWFID